MTLAICLPVAEVAFTMVFKRALELVPLKTKGMIRYFGNGGQYIVDNNEKLRSAWNFIRDDDGVPINANLFNPARRRQNLGKAKDLRNFNVVLLGKGKGGEVGNHNWEANYASIYSLNNGRLLLPKGAKDLSTGGVQVRWPIRFPRFKKAVTHSLLDFSGEINRSTLLKRKLREWLFPVPNRENLFVFR